MDRKLRWFAILIMVLFVGGVDAFAKVGVYSEMNSETLRGVKSIYVRVAPIDPTIEQEGLTTAQIRRDTEHQLQREGIKILPEEEFNRLRRTRNYPLGRLEVIVTIKDMNKDAEKLYSIIVRFSQVAFLSRAPVIKLFAPTWESQTIGYSGDLSVVTEGVKARVEEFISAYTAANSK
ncbi:MAG: hypothetical protein B1H12_04740 [Desulfobacteraceae bacterium 4484_190.2]|nr:MAG: hypothetical protein B1H12_04740 [Desulfobacteraceae bacterium 4484_190.2]